MFCKYCGSNIDDKAVICPHCGVPTDNMQSVAPVQPARSSSNPIGIAGFVVTMVGLCGGNILLLIPGVVGLILSFVGFIKAKKQNLSTGLSIAGLCVSIVSLAFWIYIWVQVFYELAQEGITPPVI